MTFLRTFSGKKNLQTPVSLLVARSEAILKFALTRGLVESSWDVCRQMSKSRGTSFSCEENAGSKKTRREKAMGIYIREKKDFDETSWTFE